MYIILNMDEQSEVAGACLKSWPSWNMVIIAYKIRFIFNKIMTSHYKESLPYQKLRLSRTCFFINKHVWKTNLLTCLSPWLALKKFLHKGPNVWEKFFKDWGEQVDIDSDEFNGRQEFFF